MTAYSIGDFVEYYSFVYLIQALFNIIVAEIPLGLILGLIPALAWWFILRFGGTHSTSRIWIASLTGGVFFGGLTWLLWIVIHYEGVHWIIALSAFIIMTFTLGVVGHHSVSRESKRLADTESAAAQHGGS
jgi:hypothetical protein